MSDPDKLLEDLKNQVVVVDTAAAYVYAGTLANFDSNHLVL